jgi:putative membrane protein
MIRIPLHAALTALLLVSPAAMAQDQQQPAAGETGTQAATAQPVDTPTFVNTVMSSDQFEITSSQIIVDEGRSGDVQAFARQMIEDHTASSQKLMEALQQSGGAEVPSTPPGLLPKHQALVEQIQSGGDDKEKRYLEAQLMAHQEAVALFGSYAQNGDDPALVAFAKETLPALQDHLEKVEGLNQAR